MPTTLPESRIYPVGTPVSVRWKDGRTYDAVVIIAPKGKKRAVDTNGQMYVQFAQCGEWDLVYTKDVYTARDAARAGNEVPVAPRHKLRKHASVVTPGVIDTGTAALACISKEWQNQPASEAARMHDLLRLAYATEGHGHTLLRMILACPMCPIVAQAYEVARSDGNPQWLLTVLREMNRHTPVEQKPVSPVSARAKRSRCIESDDSDAEEVDSDDSDAEEVDSESDAESSDSVSEAESEDAPIGQGVSPNVAERLARVLSTRVTSAVQHNRARDAFAEIYVAMGCMLTTRTGNALQAHYAALLLESEGAPSTKWLMSEDKIVQALRRSESKEELQWVEDTLPRSSVSAAVPAVLRGVQGAYYVLQRAVWDMTNALRGDIPAARWGLLTHVDFEVGREFVRHVRAQDRCEACDKTRPVTSRFHWSCYGEQRREWLTGSDCAGRILAARQAHDFTYRVVQSAQCPVNADTEKQLLEEWRKVYDEITKLAC